jgi:DNA-directed RNA polymerase subunit N (RpoN/RPB10)
MEEVHKETQERSVKMIPIIHTNIQKGIKTPEEKAMDTIGLDRQCCRRMMLTNVDFTDII